MITVDFDMDFRSDLDMLIFYYRLKDICSKYKCEITKTKKGIHAVIYVDMDFFKQIAVRSYLLDDPERIEFDIKRYYRNMHRWINTIFIRKIDNHGEYIAEKLLF